MKYDPTGDLEKDQGGIGGLRGVFDHAVSEPWDIRVPQTTPGRRDVEGSLVEKFI